MLAIRILRKPQVNSSSFYVLTRHFFRRLFLNETVLFEDRMVASVIGVISILSILSAHMANSLLFKYLIIREVGQAWAEISVFISFVMLQIGLITLFQWDVIFLDRKDYLNLSSLPLRPSAIFSAKFFSLAMFIGMFVVGINSISSLFFAFYLGESKKYGLLSTLVLLLIHLLVMFMAACFTFFTLAFIAGLFNILLRGKLFRQISEFIRFALIVAHIFFLYHFLIDTGFITNQVDNLEALKSNPSAFMMNYPPLWFTGMYQALRGDKESFFLTLATKGFLALAVSVAVFFLFTYISHNRYLKKMSPDGSKHSQAPLIKRTIEPLLNLTILRNPVERALFWFYHSVLTRSRIHKNRLISYFGIGLGIALIIFVSGHKSQPGNMLSFSLVLTFFVLVGIRDATQMPLKYEANWIFQLTEGTNAWPYFLALRKSIIIFFILPLFILLFLFYSNSLGWAEAFIYCCYVLVFTVLLMEILFFRQRKFPFVCSYLPNKSQMHVFWIIYVLSFLVYVLLPQRLAHLVLGETTGFIIFSLSFVLIISASWFYHRHYFYPSASLIYEDRPEPSIDELFRLT